MIIKNEKLKKIISKSIEHGILFSMKNANDVSTIMLFVYMFYSLALYAGFADEFKPELAANTSIMFAFTLSFLTIFFIAYIFKNRTSKKYDLISMFTFLFCLSIGFVLNFLFIREYFLRGMHFKTFFVGITIFACLKLACILLYKFEKRLFLKLIEE